MSAKSDRDNRSNQLNPNNPAFYSSREWTAADDNDDEWSLAPPAAWCRPPVATPWLAIYTVDLVNADGEAKHLIFVTQRPEFEGPEAQAKVEKESRDIAESVLNYHIRQFTARTKAPLMLVRLGEEAHGEIRGRKIAPIMSEQQWRRCKDTVDARKAATDAKEQFQRMAETTARLLGKPEPANVEPDKAVHLKDVRERFRHVRNVTPTDIAAAHALIQELRMSSTGIPNWAEEAAYAYRKSTVLSSYVRRRELPVDAADFRLASAWYSGGREKVESIERLIAREGNIVRESAGTFTNIIF